MYEVEVKVRATHEEVRAALEAHGADHLRTVEQADTYYAHPARDFAATDEALRVRRVTETGSEQAHITYKGPLVDDDSKTRRELETAVGEGDVAGDIFEALGFAAVATVEKVREIHETDGYTVVLDSVAGLGEFVEVETEAADIDPAREGAFSLLRALGLDPSAQLRTSYLGLLLADTTDTPE
jgi:adenylate cyclase class 2